MGIQLKVGQTVRLRSGAIDKVCGHDASQASTGIEFQLESGGSYWADGHWIRDQDTPLDVVEIISEPADCVVKELRELTAHVTKEFAELHERIAKLEQPETVSWDGQPDSPGDPFAVDWSEAPADATAHVFNDCGQGSWLFGVREAHPAGNGGWNYAREEGACGQSRPSRITRTAHISGMGWRLSFRRRPAPEFKRGDRVMVRDSENGDWERLYFVRMGSGNYPYVATRSGPWAMSDNFGAGYRFCRHPTPDELEGY